VTVPALVSVTVFDPEGVSEPVQPSPAFPPVAEQESEFFELHTREMLWPIVSVELLLDKVTLGVASFALVAGTAT
jgi:hypothetical protein